MHFYTPPNCCEFRLSSGSHAKCVILTWFPSQWTVNHPFPQQVKIGATIHLTINELQSVHLSFSLAITPWQGKSIGNRCQVLPILWRNLTRSLALTCTKIIAPIYRKMGATSSWKDNPLCLFFSGDDGLTWSPPHRSGVDGVYPSLVVMSNGILACSYGRPGAKIMFSTDNGNTWTDHTSINVERYSGYSWIVAVGPYN